MLVNPLAIPTKVNLLSHFNAFNVDIREEPFFSENAFLQHDWLKNASSFSGHEPLFIFL